MKCCAGQPVFFQPIYGLFKHIRSVMVESKDETGVDLNPLAVELAKLTLWSQKRKAQVEAAWRGDLNPPVDLGHGPGLAD